MAVFGAVLALLMGLAMIRAGGLILVEWFRSRSRVRRAAGIIIDRREGPTEPGIRSQEGIFRFTTEDGRVITKDSSFYSYPGPRIGKQVTVVYDPVHPEKSAEIAWVRRLWLILSPLLVAGGVALCVTGVMPLFR